MQGGTLTQKEQKPLKAYQFQIMINLQAFWGFANYYGIYIHGMQNLRASLNNLFKKSKIGLDKGLWESFPKND